MGTRADFYVGRGETAEWLGSIAWDGYPEGVFEQMSGRRRGVTNTDIYSATDEASYRRAVDRFLDQRDDGTRPEHGWPWPWDDSGTTDYAYSFDQGALHVSGFGKAWVTLAEYEAKTTECERLRKLADESESEEDIARADEADEWWEKLEPGAVHPDMKSRQNVTLGKRSGVLILGG